MVSDTAKSRLIGAFLFLCFMLAIAKIDLGFCQNWLLVVFCVRVGMTALYWLKRMDWEGRLGWAAAVSALRGYSATVDSACVVFVSCTLLRGLSTSSSRNGGRI